jgi:hypothetical protein
MKLAYARKVLQFILIVVAILLLPSKLTPIAYGKITDAIEQDKAHIEAAGPTTILNMDFWENAHGSIIPGDLFFIDAVDEPGNTVVNLYITNTDELTHYFKYLILKISVYSQNYDGQWSQVKVDGKHTDSYITLRSNPMQFVIPGNSRYKIRVDSGSFYSLPAGENSNITAPHFYLTAEPA